MQLSIKNEDGNEVYNRKVAFGMKQDEIVFINQLRMIINHIFNIREA